MQSLYQKAIKFAAQKHAEQHQTIPGTELPYVVHLSNVAMEILIALHHTEDFDGEFAIQLALLHDTLEDTTATVEELAVNFDVAIAEGVAALTKNATLPKSEKMNDSLQRIKKLQKEVWAVKLADRITNLQQPPAHWDGPKIKAYKDEAVEILHNLRGGNDYLERRLKSKIREYEEYIQ